MATVTALTSNSAASCGHSRRSSGKGVSWLGSSRHVPASAGRRRPAAVCSLEAGTTRKRSPESTCHLLELPSGVLGLVLQSLAHQPGQPGHLRLSKENTRGPHAEVSRASFPLMLGSMALLAALQIASVEPASAAEAHSALPEVTGLAGSSYALAFIPGMGPSADGPFWDNVLRFVVYFITVFTGGLFSLFKPVVELAKNPFTLFLLVAVLGGGFLLTYLTLSAMLGLSEADTSLYSY